MLQRQAAHAVIVAVPSNDVQGINMKDKYFLGESVKLENALEGYKCLVYHEFQDESQIWGGGGGGFKSAIVDIRFKNFQFDFSIIKHFCGYCRIV